MANYSAFSLDAFRANLINGIARNNLFLVSGTFPGSSTGAINFAASVAGALFGGSVAGAIQNTAAAIGLANPSAQVSFLCNSTTIPDSTLGKIEVPFHGRVLKIPGDRAFAEWKITVYNDGSYNLRKAFESWSNLINTYEGNVGPNAMDNLMTDWFVQPLTREGNPIATYKFIGCWPSSIGSVSLASGPEQQPSTFDVTFTYQYHEMVGVTT